MISEGPYIRIIILVYSIIYIARIITAQETILPCENEPDTYAVQRIGKDVQSNGCSKPSFIQVIEYDY